jgi:nucleoid-associated protein EbfC
MNMKQIQKMMKQAQSMQKRLEEQLGELTIEGSSGGGMVTVTMDGQKNLKSITIKPEVVDPDDVEMLQDLVVAAFNDAVKKADDAMKSQLGGLGLGDMLGGM